ncbi:MAG: HTH domain-containing protein [Bacteroidales bacterium]|nr:HTH domain-containing protein [Bacteroidales bacterium]
MKIVQAMRENAHITAAELASMLGITERAVYKNIAKLRDTGIIRRIGSDVAGEWEVLK